MEICGSPLGTTSTQNGVHNALTMNHTSEDSTTVNEVVLYLSFSRLPVAVVPVVIRSGPRSTESAFVCTYANNYYTEERLNVACNDVGVMQAARNVFGIKDNTPPKWYICQLG